MPDRRKFDGAYYERYYGDSGMSASDRAEMAALGDFVCAYLNYLEQPMRRVLDIGCGLGTWRKIIARHFPRARYTGVEFSAYLCKRHGWLQGSVLDFEARTPFDLVICQDVLQYLSPTDATAAIDNLARLCRGALYFNALTKEDWEQNCDQARTDSNVYMRTGDWYRHRLRKHFVNAGGGLFMKSDSPVVLWELARLE